MKANVLLAIDSKHPDFPLFELLAEKIKLKDRTLLHLCCDEAEFSGSFARLRLAEPENHRGLVLWIQNQDVKFAYADPDDKVIGFSPSC